MLFFMFVGFDLAAQGPPGGGPGGQSGCIPTCIPIDGGISFLVAAGAALGGKKLFDQIKQR
ncbi:hypothetical protein KFE98_00855 [bacterium SCSIO 12741]|nr:hypothetical protein KFE98_00855 [bacterium SCSIO 12741]